MSEVDTTAAARALAARRRVIGEGKCLECGQPIVLRTPSRYLRRYCGQRCWQRAYWREHKAEKNEYQRRYRARRREIIAAQQQQETQP